MADPTNPGEPNLPAAENSGDAIATAPAESRPAGGGFFKYLGWPMAIMVVAGCSLVAFVVQQCSPGAQALKLADAGAKWSNLAAGLDLHLVTETFTSHLDSLRPDMNNRMLVAEGKSTESFSAKDESWHGTATADLRVPATYHYFVALSDPWELHVQVTPAGVVGDVLAPVMRSLDPSVNTSQLEMKSSNGWANYNGSALADNLLKDLTMKLNERAMQQEMLYFPTARESVEKFVHDWMLKEYKLPPETPFFLHVKFRNETGAVPATTIGTALVNKSKG